MAEIIAGNNDQNYSRYIHCGIWNHKSDRVIIQKVRMFRSFNTRILYNQPSQIRTIIYLRTFGGLLLFFFSWLLSILTLSLLYWKLIVYYGFAAPPNILSFIISADGEAAYNLLFWNIFCILCIISLSFIVFIKHCRSSCKSN